MCVLQIEDEICSQRPVNVNVKPSRQLIHQHILRILDLLLRQGGERGGGEADAAAQGGNAPETINEEEEVVVVAGERGGGGTDAAAQGGAAPGTMNQQLKEEEEEMVGEDEEIISFIPKLPLNEAEPAAAGGGGGGAGDSQGESESREGREGGGEGEEDASSFRNRPTVNGWVPERAVSNSSISAVTELNHDHDLVLAEDDGVVEKRKEEGGGRGRFITGKRGGAWRSRPR